MDYTILHCRSCGNRNIIPLSKPLPLSLNLDEELPIFREEYHESTKLLSLIEKLKEEVDILKKKNVRLLKWENVLNDEINRLRAIKEEDNG